MEDVNRINATRFLNKNNLLRKIIGLLGLTLISASASAHSSDGQPRTDVNPTPVISDIMLLEKTGAQILTTNEESGVGFAELTPDQQNQLSVEAHKLGRCGGYEAFAPGSMKSNSLELSLIFHDLEMQNLKAKNFHPSTHGFSTMVARADIADALNEVSEANLRSTVEFMSAFNDRFHRGAQPNVPVEALKTRIENVMKSATVPYQIDFISHQNTQQRSLRVRIPGSARPGEILVFGAHLDSINQEWMGSRLAPGSDDNASGSSNILETLRILSTKAQPERTTEFFWYAGEEGGLLGSSEIARQYKSEGKDVVSVMQLDMTLFAGAGEFVLGSMTDFTSPWFRSYLENINSIYIKAKIVNNKCGYGCSDHASWHRQGYPTIMPFESTFARINHNLHTSRDVIDSNSNFKHSAMFSKIAIAIAMDLGNSTLREK